MRRRRHPRPMWLAERDLTNAFSTEVEAGRQPVSDPDAPTSNMAALEAARRPVVFVRRHRQPAQTRGPEHEGALPPRVMTYPAARSVPLLAIVVLLVLIAGAVALWA